MLVDAFGRNITYLRLAVTDRCNLRCFYCMPECGIDFVRQHQLLSYEEMLRVVKVGVSQGITKVRITGGEPFVRKDLMGFLSRLRAIDGLETVHITTNGTLTEKHVPQLKELGVDVNLSWDTLDRERFTKMSHRDELDAVNQCFEALMTHNVPTKINMVVMNGHNDQDIVPMAKLASINDVEVRFLEEMPFNGADRTVSDRWNHTRILEELENKFGPLNHFSREAGGTSDRYQPEGWKGLLGIIAAHSRTFCGSCNRLRITPQGQIRTCLYSAQDHNLRDLMRGGASDSELIDFLKGTVASKKRDGHEAELSSNASSDSMATIGG